MDADEVAQVLRRLQLLEQAATEQLNARRGAEHAMVEASRAEDLQRQLARWWSLVFSGGQTSWTQERKHGPIGAS